MKESISGMANDAIMTQTPPPKATTANEAAAMVFPKIAQHFTAFIEKEAPMKEAEEQRRAKSKRRKRRCQPLIGDCSVNSGQDEEMSSAECIKELADLFPASEGFPPAFDQDGSFIRYPSDEKLNKMEIDPNLKDELLKLMKAQMNGEEADQNNPLLMQLREMAQFDHTPKFPPFIDLSKVEKPGQNPPVNQEKANDQTGTT